MQDIYDLKTHLIKEDKYHMRKKNLHLTRAVWCSVLHRVAVCCSVLQCVEVCCSVLHHMRRHMTRDSDTCVCSSTHIHECNTHARVQHACTQHACTQNRKTSRLIPSPPLRAATYAHTSTHKHIHTHTHKHTHTQTHKHTHSHTESQH